MMCATCHLTGHDFWECLFPQSCTCQHRASATDIPEFGRESEASEIASHFTDQEHNANAADRLDP